MFGPAQEARLEALTPFFEKGMKPLQISKALAENPEGPQLKPKTITKYGQEWRRRTGNVNPVPTFEKKGGSTVADEVKEEVKSAQTKPEEQPKPEEQKPEQTPGQQSDMDRIREFCTLFPDQCKTMFGELGEKLNQGISQMGQEVRQGVAEAIQQATAVEPPDTGKVDEETVNRVLSGIPAATLLQWYAGHMPACPACQEVAKNNPSQLISPLQSMLETVKSLQGKEVTDTDERPGEGSTARSEEETKGAEHPDRGEGGRGERGSAGTEEQPKASEEVPPKPEKAEEPPGAGEGSPGGGKPEAEPEPGAGESEPTGGHGVTWGRWTLGG